MKLIESLGPHKLFYSSPGNTEGLTDVKQTLIQHDGTVLLDSIPMTELGDGVYEYTYNFTSIGWYVSHGISDSLGGSDLESLRVGDPSNDYVYAGGPNDTTVSYEVNTLDDTNVMTGWMNEIGTTKIFWVDVTSLPDDKYFFKMNGRDTARFNYPFILPTITPKGVKLVLEKGYNLSAFSGTGKYNFDSTAGVWVSLSNDIENAKASDLYEYIKYHYPAVIVHYIKSYYEHPTKRYKIYVPEITPNDNENNFPLVQVNQESHPEKNAFYTMLTMAGDEITINCR